MVWCLGFAFLGSYGPLIGALIGLVDLDLHRTHLERIIAFWGLYPAVQFGKLPYKSSKSRLKPEISNPQNPKPRASSPLNPNLTQNPKP